MTHQISYTKIEQTLLPGFRDRMDKAESTEDARKIFAETASRLLSNVTGKADVRYEDVSLAPEKDAGYTLTERLSHNQAFESAWESSDLPRILSDLAKSAVNRVNHLNKNPSKTEAKMFHQKQGKTHSR